MSSTNAEKLSGRVLSIQSHVVRGYCGNKSAVFPLQLLGFDVDSINTVQFSNHTGYASFKGQVLEDQELLELFEGLVANELHKGYTHILTGYARSVKLLEATCNVIEQVKKANPDAIYLCDPVLGDHGKLYLPEELIPVFRDKAIKLADIICPNQFEAELLSGVKITDLRTAIMAIERLHEMGPVETVIISSTEVNFGSGSKELIALASTKKTQADGRSNMYQISVSRIDAHFIGTGDLFAAQFLAWFSKTNFDLKTTLENVLASMQAIIKHTYDFAQTQPGGLSSCANIELRIIQGRHSIIKPEVTLFAEPIMRTQI